MKRLLSVLFLAAPGAAFAHAGHGHVDPNSLLHWLITPEHAIPAIVFAVVVSWILFRRARRATQKK